jgi:hypothetical protein
MAVSGAQISAVVQVTGADKAKSDLSDVGKSADNASGGFGNMLKQGLAFSAAGAIFNAGAKAVNFLGSQLSSTLTIAMAHQQVMAQTAQAIKSTGDASGMSAQALDNLAMSLSKTTTFSDDTIQSGENLLLTFTGIGQKTFPQATQTMLDMAQAMHTGPTQEAMLLGKALNDPATGLSALTRVGVTFSDQEKEQIKTMMAHNDVAGAQAVMLKELQTEFGGSAKAAGQTFGGQLLILKNNLQDVKQQIGGALLPILGQMLSTVSGAVMPVLQGFGNWFANTAAPAIQNFGHIVGDIFTNVGHYLSLFDLGQINYAWKQLTTAVDNALKPLGSAGNAFKSMSPFLTTLRNDFSQLLDGGIRTVAGIISNIATSIQGFSKGGGGLSSLGDMFKQLGPPIQNIAKLMGGELGKEFKDLGQDAQQVGQWFMTSVVPAIKQALPGFENLGKTILTTVIPAAIQIRGVFVDVIQHAFEKFAPIIEKIVPPLIKFAGILANDVGNGLKFIMPYVLQATKAIGQFADQIMDRVAPIITNIINGMTPVLQNIFHVWSVIWPGMSQVLQGVFQIIVGIVQVAWSILTGIFKIALDLISGNWGQVWQDMQDMFKGIWDGIKTILSGAWTEIQGVFNMIVSGIVNYFQGLFDSLVGHSIIPDMINGIVSWFEQLPGRAMAFITNLINNITSGLGGLGAKALGWAKDMLDMFVQGIQNGIAGVEKAASNIADAVKKFLHFSKPDVGPLADVDNWMPDFGDLLAKGLNDQLSKISGASLKLATSMAVNMNPGLTAIPAGVSGVPSSLSQSNSSQNGPIIIQNIIDGKEITNNAANRIIKGTRVSGPIRSNLQ